MQAADFKVQEDDPFEDRAQASFGRRDASRNVNRIRLMWAQMREGVIAHFPEQAHQTIDIEAYMAEEESAAVRVVLGHFIFVYIHPYLDGNGRMGSLDLFPALNGFVAM